MKFIPSLFGILFCSSVLFGQVNLNGVWQGVIIPAGKTIDQASIFWLKIEVSSEKANVISRTEIVGEPYFALKKVNGIQKDSTLTLSELVIYKKETAPGLNWCKLTYELTYNSKTGYLSGNFNSNECRRTIGKIILYSSAHEFSESASSPMSSGWYKEFTENYKAGRPAPKIMELERKNFVFKPLYFDFDKADIKPEYESYLIKMAKIVMGHSDLRVKVIGNTDAFGTDAYNMGLSERRAKAIVDFFAQHGLRRDKIVLDFDGERNPVADNETSEGRQENRRVDFSFIF
jgi:outer membrane protein OmpA-like peptidoglycan-associated protein